jgi:hypothetical protein
MERTDAGCEVTERGLVVQIDERKVQVDLDEVAGSTVEETPNTLLDAEEAISHVGLRSVRAPRTA